MRTAVTGKGKVSEHYLSPFFSNHLEKMAQFLFPGWLIISYFLLWKKEGIDIPGWENDFLVKILAGKSS